MKIVSIYSNDAARFPRIDFHEGLSVIFARVKDPTLTDEDSHNLGKTLLIRIIDFVLLATPDKAHPLKQHQAAFGGFVFFLEIETSDHTYVTVRRAVSGHRAISIMLHEARGLDCNELSDEDWYASNLGEGGARKILDGFLELDSIRPYDYRKGLGYFLRRQADYEDEFRISRFGRGKDRDWKPFMALMLGFDHDLVARKYELDRREEEIGSALRELQASGAGAGRYDEIRGVVELRSQEIDRIRAQINRFDFKEVESQISHETVRDIESRIADLNERRFILDREEAEIEHSLGTEFGFDLQAIQRSFDEARAALPDKLVRDYRDLVKFNEQLSRGRKQRLEERRQGVRRELDLLQDKLEQLNAQRVRSLEVLTQRETLAKFRALQKRLLGEEEDLVRLRQRLDRLDYAGQLQQQMRRIEEERLRLVDEIDNMVRRGSERYSEIRGLFAQFVRSILSVPAVLSISVNKLGNIEFHTGIVEAQPTRRETAEGEGASYKKILCVCFDLALLVSHARDRFYRFVYHDGVFEGLDDRRKLSLLETVRGVCSNYGLQYILTVIDSDLPRDQRDDKVLFHQREIVRELHDGGDDGRLFRMPAF